MYGGFLFCFLFLSLFLITCGSTEIPVLTTRGTYYDVGFDMGKTFLSRIQDFYEKDASLNNKLLPYISSQHGQKVFADYLTVVRKFYPQYLQELIGLADGSKLTFIQVFTMSIRNELNAHIDGVWKSEHCSDVHINYPQQTAIGHNEDADPLVKDRAYIVNITIVENGEIVEDFIAYTYPGYLPGNAFGFTKSGMVLTLNGLYPTGYGELKLPRVYVSRALLAQSTLEGVEEVLLSNGVGSAYAFSLNVADLSKTPKTTINYEVDSLVNKSMSLVSKMVINLKPVENGIETFNTTKNYFHFNKFEHPDTVNIKQFPQHIVSSIHRRKRVQQLPLPTDIHGIKNILGDTADSLFPIYRTPRPSDDASTAATAIFDLTGCKLNIFTDNPKTSVAPIQTYNLPNCEPY